LERGLQTEGYEVATAATGEAGYELAMAQPFDCVVLDLMLPGRNGIEVLGDLRRAGKMLPVLILTARDAVEDRVIGLDAGADDYLVKPFAFAELLARIRALLRRSGQEEPLCKQIADLSVNIEKRRAMRGAEEISLTPR